MTALVAAAGVATGFLAATGLVLLLARRTPDDLTAVVDATREPGTWLRTWLVTVYRENASAFLDAAAETGMTVEELRGAGDAETYELLVGEPGSGWVSP